MKDSYASIHPEREALSARVVRLRHSMSHATLLFLEKGRLTTEKNEHGIDGPALCYWPANDRPSIVLAPGASALIMGLSDMIVLDAIGARAESVHLRILTEKPFDAALTEPGMEEQVKTLVRWFGDELAQSERPSPMSLSAFLRLLFICALRVYQTEPVNSGQEFTTVLRRFRHLVELNYRAHWSVSRYADELGVDYDRLHRICKRETGRSPGELVHERLTAEAKARLEKTGAPLKTIAAELGFSDATRFSHYFKRRTDMAPGAYRAIVSRPDGEDLVELRRGFSDWP